MKEGIGSRYISEDGLSAYDILNKFDKDCPIKLPHARSMTQAKIDYEHREQAIISWYESQKMPDTKIKD